jgi:tape measure domain-containing protein
LRTKGDTSGVDRFKRSLSALGFAVGGISFAGIARGAIQAADSVTLLQSKLRLVTSGSEELTKVQNQVVNLARQTRTDFSSVGELYARVARSSKQLGVSQSEILSVTKAVTQAIQISGNTATEASAGMIQLAQALASGVLRGDELRSVLEQMPRVAEAIATGLGTTVGQLRKLGEQGKLTSDLVFKALISQADTLNSEFGKLQPTITQSFGVLVGELKLATAEFLKVTGTTDRFTGSINTLANAIRGLSGSFQSAFGSMNEYWSRFNKWLDESDRKIHKLLGINHEWFEQLKRQGLAATNPLFIPFLGLTEDREQRRTRGPTGAQRGRGRSSEPLLPPTVDIEEFRVTTQRMRDDYGDVLRDLEESTRTSVQRQSAEYIKLRTTLEFLRDEKLITPEVFEKRRTAALDELLPEFDLNEIRAKYKVVKKETTELGEFMKGVWQEVGRSIQSTLSDALYEWRLSWRSLIDIARRALADITAAIITSGIKNALKNAASGGGGGGGSGGSFNWISAIAGFFGFAAGGGRVDRPTIVGEDGTELVLPPARVMNQRQMAFSGGGGSVTYSPNVSIAIVEREDPERTKQEMYQAVSLMLSQDKAEFIRTLQRSGYEVRG